MASIGLQMCLTLALMGMLWAGANAQSCTPALTNLTPCLNYVTGNTSNPSPACCLQLKTVVQSSPQCVCSMLSIGASLGITINQTLALKLPGSCQVQTPSLSQCNGGKSGTPSTAPAASPSGSPSEGAGAITPSASDIPSGTGSKSVPSIDVGSSDASIAKASLHSVICLIFIATVAKSEL